MSTDVEESMEFFEFMSSSKVGGNGSRYGFGNNPTAMEEQQTIKELLEHINALSGAALNAISTDDTFENVYIKRRLIHAKKEVREAYLRLMDSKR
jgi:hypothetical protein